MQINNELGEIQRAFKTRVKGMKNILYVLPTVGEMSQTFIVDEINLVGQTNDISILSMTEYLPGELSLNWQEINEKYQIAVALQPCFNVGVKSILKRCRNIVLISRLLKLLAFKKNERYFLLWAFKNLRHDYGKITHIHCHFAGPNLSLAYAMSLLLNVKVSVNFHGYDVREWQIDKQRLVTICNATTANFVVSSSQKRKLESIGIRSDRIFVQPVGVNIHSEETAGYCAFEDEFRLVTVARLHPIKNHLMALRAIKDLIEKGYNLHYTIIGDGETLESLQRFVHDNKIGEYVTFLGALPHKKTLEIMRQNHVHLLTSIDEGAPTVVMEAMANKVVNVCTAVGGVPDLLEHNINGKLVQSEAELASVIEILNDDRSQLAPLIESAYSKACLNFDKEKLTSRKLQLIQQ